MVLLCAICESFALKARKSNASHYDPEATQRCYPIILKDSKAIQVGEFTLSFRPRRNKRPAPGEEHGGFIANGNLVVRLKLTKQGTNFLGIKLGFCPILWSIGSGKGSAQEARFVQHLFVGEECLDAVLKKRVAEQNLTFAMKRFDDLRIRQ